MKVSMTAPLAALIAVAAILAGCGGDSSEETDRVTAPDASTPTSTDSTSSDSTSDSTAAEPSSNAAPVQASSLSKAQFVKQANAICQKTKFDLNKEGEAFVKQHAGGAQREELFGDLARTIFLPAIEAEMAAIRELGAPKGEEEEVEAILSAQQAGIDEMRELAAAAAVTELESPFAEASKKFGAYGLSACVM